MKLKVIIVDLEGLDASDMSRALGEILTTAFPAVQEGDSPTERVEKIVHANPGLTGSQIVNNLSDINERTVRTCLRRLKERGVIEVVEGRWSTAS